MLLRPPQSDLGLVVDIIMVKRSDLEKDASVPRKDGKRSLHLVKVLTPTKVTQVARKKTGEFSWSKSRELGESLWARELSREGPMEGPEIVARGGGSEEDPGQEPRNIWMGSGKAQGGSGGSKEGPDRI